MDQGKNKTFGEKVLQFYRELDYKGPLPDGVAILNPYRNNPVAESLTRKFYGKYFSDDHHRSILLGINPGRFGAGITGITFTDTVRLQEKCGIDCAGLHTYEPSSAFMYDMIDQFGTLEDFYGRFFVSAVCPIGFTIRNDRGSVVNYNYYDNPSLLRSVKNFIVTTLRHQLGFGINRRLCFCLGTGKNEKYLRELNAEHGLFERIIALEHPRYIMQYRAKIKNVYIGKYLNALKQVSE